MHLPLGDQLDYKTNTEVMNARKSYNYENCGVKIYAKKISAVIDATFAVAKRKPEKKNSGFLFASAKVACITAMIFFRIKN